MWVRTHLCRQARAHVSVVSACECVCMCASVSCLDVILGGWITAFDVHKSQGDWKYLENSGSWLSIPPYIWERKVGSRWGLLCCLFHLESVPQCCMLFRGKRFQEKVSYVMQFHFLGSKTHIRACKPKMLGVRIYKDIFSTREKTCFIKIN